LPRLWSTALGRPRVDIGYVKAHRPKCADQPPKPRLRGRVVRVKSPVRAAIRSNATAPDILPGLPRRVALHFARRRLESGRPAPRRGSHRPDEASAAASPRRCAACCHTTGEPDGKIAPYHPIRRRVERIPRDSSARQGRTSPFRVTDLREIQGAFKASTSWRKVRSFDPCLRAGPMFPRKGIH